MTRSVSRPCLFALAALALAAPASHALAQAPAPEGPRRVGFLLRMGLDFGGEEIVELQFSDGDSAKLKAGQLATFSGGLLYRADAWSLEGTFGYKFDQANASNGSVKFSRLPVDVIASYRAGNNRIGGGATMHLSPKYTCDLGFAECQGVTELEFKNSVGGILQWAYGIPSGDSGWELGARVTVIKYQASEFAGELSGNSFGFFFGGWL